MGFADPDFVGDLSLALLAHLSTALIAGSRPVSRVVRFPGGTPSWDCEMLAVWPGSRISIQDTQTAGIPTGPARRVVLDFRVLLIRCITTSSAGGKPPTLSQVDVDGAVFARDMWLLTVALGRWKPDGNCTLVRAEGFRPELPQGGYSGMSALVELAVG